MRLDAAWETYRAAAASEERAVGRHPGRYPHCAESGGRWHRIPLDQTSGWVTDTFYDHGNWTAGFSAGVAWLRRVDERNAAPSPQIRGLLADLEPRAADATTHDLGFLFYPSFVVGRLVDGLGEADVAPATLAAETLAARFREPGEFIQAFGSRTDPRSAGTSTIDTMMNLPLLWWAGQRRPELTEIAHRHATTSAHSFLRDDDSTFHLIRFDPSSGELVERGTFQGASSRSCWSRGQAWAIAGFAWGYAATRDDELLDAAERACRYFEARIPDDGVVPWDFSDDGDDVVPDASASAIAALGTAILALTHPTETRRAAHASMTESLLERLADSALCVGNGDGILRRSCYSKPHGLGIGGATPWGDFYYGLALALATGRISVNASLNGARDGATAHLHPRDTTST